MTTRTEAAKMARATAATHARVGNQAAADRINARADQYDAMTDAEYETDRAKYDSPARREAIRRMAAETMRRCGR